MKNIKFSLVIPFFNSFNNLKLCIKSVYKSSIQPNEIIVVDDCSSKYQESNKCRTYVRHFKNIQYFRQKKNTGPGGARNYGVKKTKYDYIFFLDSDTQVNFNTFLEFKKKILHNKILVGIYDINPIQKNLGGIYKSSFYFYLYNHNKLEEYDHFSASCAGIEKKIFNQVNGYDTFFSKGVDFENEELGYRLIKKNKLMLDTNMKVKHKFPNIFKILILFITRSSLWMEMFVIRKKFSSSATSGDTALYLFLSPIIFLSLLFSFLINYFYFLLFIFLSLLHINKFKNFYLYHFRSNKFICFLMFFISNSANCFILLGCTIGIIKFYFNISKIKKKFLRIN